MIKISDVPLAMRNMSGKEKVGSSSVLERCLHLNFFMAFLYETSLHNSNCKCNRGLFGVVGKVAFKKEGKSRIYFCVLVTHLCFRSKSFRQTLKTT